MKITVDNALIEQAISELLPEQLGVSHFALRQKLRAALAEPAVGPVAYRYKYLNFMGDEVWSQDLPSNGKVLEAQALYASPPPAFATRTAEVPMLSDEEIAQCVKEASRGSAINRDGSTSQRIARAIESLCRRKAGL